MIQMAAAFSCTDRAFDKRRPKTFGRSISRSMIADLGEV
jgi:hypothetical protein